MLQNSVQMSIREPLQTAHKSEQTFFAKYHTYVSTDLSVLLGSNSCFTHDNNPIISFNDKVLWRQNTK